MKKINKSGILGFAIAASLMLGSCEAVDPFEVVNPNLAESNVVGQPNSSAIWLNGIKRQLAITANNHLILAEIGSDNYVNTQTFYNQFVDNLTIDYQDDDIDDAQFHMARLREMALYGLEVVGPNDPTYTTALEAEFLFYAGFAHTLLGEYFQGIPAEPGGSVLPRSQHLTTAIQYYTESINVESSAKALLGRARANYRAGNKTEAVNDANAALAADPDLLFLADFDPVNSRGNNNSLNYTVNDLQDALYDRGTFDDLQPLPRLDFLDPKYSGISASEDQSVPILKAEEAHLIIAEAAVSDGSLPNAVVALTALRTLIDSRPTRTIDESVEDRTERNPGSRPDTSSVVVDGVAGLVLDRTSATTVPTVSGSSLDVADAALITSLDDMLELIYLTRQEVFIAEGRRFVDMGLTFVISQNEQLNNPSVSNADTEADIPAFIDAVKGDLDAFTYDMTGGGTVTTTVNINQIIVANKTSAYVCPFE